MQADRNGAVAVAVVSWNTRELLDRCLSSLRAAAEDGTAEVHVVDNGSDDGSRELVAERHAWARLHLPATNLGFGPAVNLVAAATQGRWLAAANADVALAPDALAALLAAGEADPRAGALAPRLIGSDGRVQQSVHAFPTVATTAAFNLALYRLVPGLGDRLCFEHLWDPTRARYVDWAIGAFLLLRRAAFEQAGGFDEAQWMYAEDLDLGWRLRRAGWTTRYVPDAAVHHEGAAAAAQAWGDERLERWLRSTYAWQLRRRGLLRTRATALLNIGGAAARAAGLAPVAALRGEPHRSRRRTAARLVRLHAIGLEPPAALRGHR